MGDEEIIWDEFVLGFSNKSICQSIRIHNRANGIIILDKMVQKIIKQQQEENDTAKGVQLALAASQGIKPIL